MTNPILFDNRLICLNMEAKTKEDVIVQLFGKLKEHHFVKNSFLEAVLDREQAFATGLPLSNMGVAIPHTDPEHVIQPTVAVGTLKKTVPFNMMGNPDVVVDTDIVFLLAITDPREQITMLERLMALFQDELAMETIKEAVSQTEVKKILDDALNGASKA